jgi:1,2-dihydroxy-3-keto-5-methylthiopentene dioxygenase
MCFCKCDFHFPLFSHLFFAAMGDDSEYPPAFYLDEPNVTVSAAHLKKLGVLSWRIDAANYEKEGKLDRIRSERGYKNHDFVLVRNTKNKEKKKKKKKKKKKNCWVSTSFFAQSKNIPNLAEKLDTFKTEHLHYDEEIRFMIEGSGYFDCKDEKVERAPFFFAT